MAYNLSDVVGAPSTEHDAEERECEEFNLPPLSSRAVVVDVRLHASASFHFAPATEHDAEERMTDGIADRVMTAREAMETIKRIAEAIESLDRISYTCPECGSFSCHNICCSRFE